ncbi:KINASE SUPERFAMILY WITH OCTICOSAPEPTIDE/PHOX/BEM1P DOMAIN-CONTAINING PROTEIN [Salix viminalis]|uniref:KINASE SUPERFAMILY WITH OCTICOSAPEPTIDE/PHOX/BEM1P DOMAIN-CONTAINING PROTEIN n=1 Tax=Salix viminalis TaxID=40686 RepID=A0A9Q0QAK7_SALVM|nr:KINASE SUPERFAMILY WITH OCTICOSAPEPTIDE/PHOX/BEM1P DOMAIN-CONTAINING PROTEIN [Salix viminalis]
MTHEAPGTSGQQFSGDEMKVATRDRIAADRNVHYISVQTGEEFSPQFARRRVLDHNQPGQMGFNYNQNSPAGSENHAGTSGVRRKDSNCDALDHVSRTEATGHATELENWAYTENAGRYHREYVPNALKPSNYVDETNNSGRVTLGPTSSPTSVPEIPWPCQPFGARVSESTFPGKMKLLCSFGGRIMPRPNDGKLRYVGGETRIISIRNNVTWEELAKKTLVICDQSHTIKYQLPGEDLDALISVSSDEDLHHMIEEYQGLEKNGGSQRLRIFLVSSGEAGSPNSFEGKTSQQCNADSQYFVAVNGMLEHSPQKSSSGQSSASHLGTASDYKNPSPPVSPANIQYRDHKNSKSLFYVDQPFPDNNKNIGTFAAEKLPFDAAYYNNLPHGPIPLVNQACYHQYPGETNQTSKQLEMHLLHRCHSGDFLSCQLRPQNSMNSDWPAIMERAFSDSRLQENGEVAEKWLEEAVIPLSLSIDGREKSPALKIPNSSLDRPVLAPIIMDKKHQLMKFENHCGEEMSYMDLEQEELKWMNRNANYSDVDRQQYEGNVEVALNDNAMVHGNLPNLNFPPSAYHHPLDSQEYGKMVSAARVDTSENHADAMREHPQNHQSDINAPDLFVESQEVAKERLCAMTESIDDQRTLQWDPEYLPSASLGSRDKGPKVPSSKSDRSASSRLDSSFREDPVNYNEKVEKIHDRGLSYKESIDGDALYVQSQPLYDHHDDRIAEPVVIVEDVTGTTPPDIPLSLNVVPRVEEELAEGFQSDGDIEVESTGREYESEDIEGDDKDLSDSISDTAMAEIEAGIYRLQIIKNADVEEVQELGSGTFGTVYYGKWRGTDVAIKKIKSSCFSGNSSEQERLRRDFWREARILSDLHHPNVLAFYGVVPDGPGGTMATVTEYMVNGSLRRVLQKKDRSLDRRKKLIIALDAAFGMEYLHLKDIIHFDLKCDNLLVNLRDPQRPICKVGDFGLSKIKRNTLVSGGVRGTLPWMAPELLDGNSNRVSEKVDVFSFGIVMWEILTGEEPYANMQFGAIIGGIVSNTLRPPLPEHCDTGWRTLMEECWASHPEARPSFTEITDRLRNMSASLQPKRPNFANR